MLSSNIRSIFFISLLTMLVFCSCGEDEKSEDRDSGTYISMIENLSAQNFRHGDTLVLYGSDFGSERGTKYIEFSGIAVEEDAYLAWSDTLISVVVPQGAESGSVKLISRVSNEYVYEIDQPFFHDVISFLVRISLGITLVFIYLKINKIWKRKHEPEVAASQSLAGLFIYILNCILWVSFYVFVEYNVESIIDTSIYIFEGSIFFLIGTGIFVRGQKGLGLWRLIKKSLNLERKEADYLIKRFFRPANAESIINMLHQLAMIDNELDPKEQELLEKFAKEWNIEYDPEKLNKERRRGTSHNYIRLRKSLQDYLTVDPPVEQVAQLSDMMDAMINADDKVTKEEELINDELMGIMNNYLNKEDKTDRFHVLVVPQKPEHEEVVKEILPDALKINIAGGIAYSIGSFYSKTYADMICRQYQEIKLFTIVRMPSEDELLILEEAEKGV